MSILHSNDGLHITFNYYICCIQNVSTCPPSGCFVWKEQTTPMCKPFEFWSVFRSASVCWVLANILYFMNPRFGAYMTLIMGGFLISGNILWASIRNYNPLVIPFDNIKLAPTYGWCFWLNLIAGMVYAVLLFSYYRDVHAFVCLYGCDLKILLLYPKTLLFCFLQYLPYNTIFLVFRCTSVQANFSTTTVCGYHLKLGSK